jgi:hypothetical protein
LDLNQLSDFGQLSISFLVDLYMFEGIHITTRPSADVVPWHSQLAASLGMDVWEAKRLSRGESGILQEVILSRINTADRCFLRSIMKDHLIVGCLLIEGSSFCHQVVKLLQGYCNHSIALWNSPFESRVIPSGGVPSPWPAAFRSNVRWSLRHGPGLFISINREICGVHHIFVIG